MQFNDLVKQYNVLKPEIDKAMVDTVVLGGYIMGKAVKELKLLAEYVGVKHCISCANGTDALTLALKTWNVGAGDAVFVPDFTLLLPRKWFRSKALRLFLLMWIRIRSIRIRHIWENALKAP